MAALRWDTESQAYVETTEAPKRYDPESEAWVETTGMSWDPEAEEWTERWGQKVSAYVYGAANESVTIKKNGIIVSTVSTDASGKSTEKIELSFGIYTLTGSVSEWTEEQKVDKDTTKFRAMPDGDIAYWYGVSKINTSWSYVSYNVKYIEIKNVTHSDGLEKETNYTVSNRNTAHAIATINLENGSVTGMAVGNTWIVSYRNFGLIVSNPTHKTTDISSDNNSVVKFTAYSPSAASLNTYIRVYALWFE